MADSLKEVVDRISNFDGWNDADKIRLFGWYVQTQLGKERFSTADITECFNKLHLPQPANTSSSLKQMASSRRPQLLSDKKGYRLERKLLEDFNRRFKPTRTVNTDFPTPDFNALVQEEELAKILGMRWNEAFLTFDSSAYLSTIVLLGSILEGVLLAKVKANPREANTASSSPKNSTGKVVPFKQWTLDDLIRVAHECGWLDRDVKDFSSALRSYRNLVHPNQQLIEGFHPTESTCRISWEIVNAAISHISR